MRSLEIKKAPIVLPLLVLVLMLAGYTVMAFSGPGVASSIRLGQRCLDSQDYQQATVAFTRAVQQDPNNYEARIGLSKAYEATGEFLQAQEMLAPMVYEGTADLEAAQQLISVYEKSGQLKQAVEVVQQLIDQYDRDEDYAKRQELLAQATQEPRSMTQGENRSFVVRNGQLFAKGNNQIGQLGLDSAAVPELQEYQPAGFAAVPAQVTCVGRTTFVVDQEGGLWAAGENRFGQMSKGYADMTPVIGWQPIQVPGKVAQVAGTQGRLMVLLQDGTLWRSGAGADYSLERVTRFPTALQIGCDEDRIAVLTTDGRLYTSAHNTESWSQVGKNVIHFSLEKNSLVWVTQANEIQSRNGFSVPSSWITENGGCRPSVPVKEVLLQESGSLILLTPEGTVYKTQADGGILQISCPGPVAHIHAEEKTVVLEMQDGSAMQWTAGNSAAPLE